MTEEVFMEIPIETATTKNYLDLTVEGVKMIDVEVKPNTEKQP